MIIEPKGKGMFIWNLPNVDIDPAEMAQEAKDAGLEHVLIKICDGTIRYPYPKDFPIDPLPLFVKAFKDVGIQVWGWGYVYGHNPIGEAVIAIQRIKELELDGFVVNAEREYRDNLNGSNCAITYMELLRKNFSDFPIGLSSYRFPKVHAKFPWNEFLTYCNFSMPQVYWMKSTNAGNQLKATVEEYSKLSIKRPIIPTGAAFAEWGWVAKPNEVQEFMETAISLKLYSFNFWEWTHAKTTKNWDTIVNFKIEKQDVVPPKEDLILPILPDDDPDVFETYLVTADFLNIRNDAGMTKLVGYLKKGDKVNVYREKDGWGRTSHNGRQWVAMKWLEKYQENPLYHATCTAKRSLWIRSYPSLFGIRKGYLMYGEVTPVWGEKNGWGQLDQMGTRFASLQHLEKIANE